MANRRGREKGGLDRFITEYERSTHKVVGGAAAECND
jgi:hypothetical protein